MSQKIDRREWERLLARLELLSDTSPAEVLMEVHEKLDELDAAEIELVKMGDEIGELREADHPPDETAARLVHAQHSDTYLVDLALCPHPDCERLWRGA